MTKEPQRYYMHSGTSTSALGFLSVAGVVAAFCSFVLVSRLGYASTSLTPLDLLAVRFATGAGIAGPLLLIRRPRWPSLGGVTTLAGLGGIGFASLAYSGFSLAPASHGSALIHGLLPLTTAVLAYFLSGVRCTPAQAGGLILVTAGACGLVLSASGRAHLLGDLLLVCASASWACYALVLRRYGLPPTDAASIVVLVSAVAFVPVYLLAGEPRNLLEARIEAIALQAVVQGVLVGFASVWLYSHATQELGPSTVAAASSTVPGLVALAAVPLLGEELSWSTVLSVGLVVTGAFIAARPTTLAR